MTPAERAKLHTGNAAGQRTDSLMLLHVPESGPTALISLPRDSYVPIPGHGRNKINAAFAFGGPKLLIQTVEGVTGLRVDNYVEIGFGGFASIVDSVGGIKMCLPKAMKDKDAHINLPHGFASSSTARTRSATSAPASPTRSATSAGCSGSAR